MKFVKRRNSSSPNGSEVDSVVDDRKAREDLPALCEFLIETKWDDGASRQPGTVLLFHEDGAWKVAINDRDGGLVAFMTFDVLSTLFKRIDAAMQADKLDWKVSKSRGARRK